jgi:hypothetical protein
MYGIGKVVTITTEVVSAVQQPDHPIHYYTRSLLEVVVQRLSLLAVVAFASHRSQSEPFHLHFKPNLHIKNECEPVYMGLSIIHN